MGVQLVEITEDTAAPLCKRRNKCKSGGQRSGNNTPKNTVIRLHYYPLRSMGAQRREKGWLEGAANSFRGFELRPAFRMRSLEICLRDRSVRGLFAFPERERERERGRAHKVSPLSLDVASGRAQFGVPEYFRDAIFRAAR